MTNQENENKLMVLLKSDNVKERFIETVGRNGGAWITAIINAANTNPVIWECEPISVITAGLNAAALRLSLDPSSGHACILPFNTRKKINGQWITEKKATFVPQVRGLKQLAMRTNRYRYINSTKIYEGEEIEEDRMSGVQYIRGRATSKKIIGYWAGFQFVTGLEATEYMTVEECLEHGKKYSPSFNKQTKQFYAGSMWVEEFELMAEKTVMRKLLLNKGYLDPGDRDIIESLGDQEDQPVIEELGDIEEQDQGDYVEAEFSEEENMKALGFESVGGSGSGRDSQVEDAGQPAPQPVQDPLWVDPVGIYYEVTDSKGTPYREKGINELSFSLTALNKKVKAFKEPTNDDELNMQNDLLLKRDAVLFWMNQKKDQDNG